MSVSQPDNPSAPDPARNGKRRRRRGARASDEAVMTLTKQIANWQAKLGWTCAMWGLIPFLGLPLGLTSLTFGWLGYLRVRHTPEDLGIRHAVGALIMGPIEIAVNVAGIASIIHGIEQLSR
jgi:hypothetical protein